MYTESFAGDIDEILARECAKLHPVIALPQATGRMDSYGLTKNQRTALQSGLLDAGRSMARGGPAVTIQIDVQRKIVLSHWWQAANLYQTLTRNCWLAGLEGTTGKPRIKRYTH